MNIDTFVKTWRGDEVWLPTLLASIDKFAKGFRRVVIVTDWGHKVNLPKINLPVSVHWHKPSVKPVAGVDYFPAYGYWTQQAVKLSWTDYTDADYVFQIDSDSYLKAELKASQLFVDGKPVWHRALWTTRRDDEKAAWQGVVEKVVGKDSYFYSDIVTDNI